MINSSSIIESKINKNYSNKKFVAPYSTLGELRNEPNILFKHSTDEYLFNSTAFFKQFKGGSSSVCVILTKPTSATNPIIREKINNIIINENNSRPAALKFNIKYLEDLNSNNIATELNGIRRVYHVGSNSNDLLQYIKDGYNIVPSFVSCSFINYFGLDKIILNLVEDLLFLFSLYFA